MKHAFDRFIHYLQKNYFSYWVILGIDTFIALIVYLGVIYRHSLYNGDFQRNQLLSSISWRFQLYRVFWGLLYFILIVIRSVFPS